MSAKQLSIVIVSWNVCDLLRACLHAIYAQSAALELDVIVVDSGSADQTVTMIESQFPQVNLLAQTENVGFPRGNNIGMAAAQHEFVLLLNPDTVVLDDALLQLVSFLEAHPTVGMVGPELLNPDRTHQSSRRRFPTVATLFFESTWLQAYAPSAILNRYYVRDSGDAVSADIDWISGAAMLTRQQVIAQVGGMDEAYFMYSEELDWCRRIKAVGWRIVYRPTAKIVHHVGKSSEQAVTHRHINFNRAKLRYARKYHGRAVCYCLRAALLLGYVQQLLLESVKMIVGHKRALRWQRVQSYARVIGSRLKPAGY